MASKKRSREETVAVTGSAPSSSATADALFRFLLGIDSKTFFEKYFEKKCLFYHRSEKGMPNFFATHSPMPHVATIDWSSSLMLKLVAEKELHYTTDLNVVRYEKEQKKRIPFRTSGRVDAGDLKKCFSEDSWSVRFLRPAEHSASVAALVGLLEEVFQCSCGVNSYWTPKNSQGFAPHYDDVDVFLLQLEGSKRWRLYEPPEDVDVLSRHSSEDYKPDQLRQPTMTATLRPGDVLYMPRGAVHQGDTPDGEDSLHITFSAYQMHTLADLMLRMTSYHIETLAANDIMWRRGLPRSWFRTLGFAYSRAFADETGVCALHPEEAEDRAKNLKLIRHAIHLFSESLQLAPSIDHGVDRYAMDVLSRCQPPPEHQQQTTLPSSEATLLSNVVLKTGHAIRLVMSVPSEAQVYHIGSNSTVTLQVPLGELRFERDFAAAIATLISSHPSPVTVTSLPMPGFEEDEDANENRLILVNALIQANVLVVVE